MTIWLPVDRRRMLSKIKHRLLNKGREQSGLSQPHNATSSINILRHAFLVDYLVNGIIL